MKLKYYLRGIGIGVIITTIIFMISISIHKDDAEQETMLKPDSESKTVAEAENSEQEVLDTTISDTSVSDTGGVEPPKVVVEQIKNDVETKEPSKPKKDNVETEKIRFQISGGEYSDVVCKKLAEADLIDDSQEFNRFLIENNYDNFILPGVYDIPMGATYEEIAVLLTTKVE